MLNFIASKKIKFISSGIVIVLSMFVGYLARPTVDEVVDVVASVFEPEPVSYSAPISEFDQRVTAMFTSPEHQKLCRDQAEVVISLQLVDKYIEKSKEAAKSADYNIPATLLKYSQDSANAIK